MSTSEDLRKALDQRIKNMMFDNLYLGKVTAVNLQELTCDVQALDSEIEDFGVLIRSSLDLDIESGIIIIPKVGSMVMVGANNKHAQVLVSVDEPQEVYINTIDKVYINGKDYSMVKAETLQEELVKLNANVELIIAAINSAVVGGADGGALFKTNLIGTLVAKQMVNFSQIKNENIKHG